MLTRIDIKGEIESPDERKEKKRNAGKLLTQHQSGKNAMKSEAGAFTNK